MTVILGGYELNGVNQGQLDLKLDKSANLGDVPNSVTARANLGAADDALVMKLAGAQNVTGAKRFTVFPEMLAVGGTAIEARSPGDGLTQKWDLVHNGDSGSVFHITGGGSNGSVDNSGAMIALGVRYGSTGILINHYGDNGPESPGGTGRDTVGFYLNNRDTVNRTSAHGFRGINNSASSRFMTISATRADAATLIQLDTSQAMNAGSILQRWLVNSSEVGRVNADTGAELGKLVWARTIETIAPSSGITPIIRVADENTAARTEVYLSGKTIGETGMFVFRWAGSTTLMYAHHLSATTDRFKWLVGRGAQNKGSHTMDTMIEVQGHGGGGRMAFFAGTPRQKPSGWGLATGTATRTTFDTAAVTLPELAQRVKALIDDLHTTGGLGLIGA